MACGCSRAIEQLPDRFGNPRMQPLAAIPARPQLLVLAACKTLGKQAKTEQRRYSQCGGLSARFLLAVEVIDCAVKVPPQIINQQPSYSTLLPQPQLRDTFQRADTLRRA